MSKALIALAAILILGIGTFAVLRNQGGSPTLPETQTQPQTQQKSTSQKQFSNPKKSAHYESNTPEHGAVLAGVLVNVVIDFNFDLVKGSEIMIQMASIEYGVGETMIDVNKLAMRKKMDSNAPDGLYTVSYKACWADGNCHDGMFQFKIDRTSAKSFEDMTDKKEVMIDMKNFAFSPTKVKVSRGAKITWTNQDSVIHTVNTDAHPAHTYYLDQNSRDLKKGDTYPITFSEPGIYLYHCTPHASFMMGQILVE